MAMNDSGSEDEFAFLLSNSDTQEESEENNNAGEEPSEEDLSFLYAANNANASSSSAGRVESQSTVTTSYTTTACGRGRGQARGGKRGRPRGVTKILRQAMNEQSNANVMESQSTPPDLQPGSIAYARAARAANAKAKACKQNQAACTVVAPVSTNTTVCALTRQLQQGLVGTVDAVDISFLQKCLSNAAWVGLGLDSSSDAASDLKESFTAKLMNAPVGSNRMLAYSLDVSESSFAEQAIQSASALYEAGNILWGSLLHTLGKAIDSGKFEPLLLIRKFRYDETPLRNRVNVHDRVTGAVVQDVSDHAKLMQTEFGVRILCRNASDGTFWMWSGCLPTLLQALDRTTARCTKKSLTNILEALPALRWLSAKIPYRLHLSTIDRYSANILAEKSLQSDDLGNVSWVRGQTFCDAHRIAQAHSAAAALVPQDTSGMLATALCQRDLGALASLRAILAEVILSKLEIVYDSPPKGRAAQYRQEVFDLLLPLPSDLSRQRKDCKTLVRTKQRFVLGHLLNGDLESLSVVHYCPYGCCRSLSATEKKVKQWLCWAFLPHKMPKYVPSRWTGQEAAVTWCALLMTHHGLFTEVMLKFTGTALLDQRVLAQEPTHRCDEDLDFLEALATETTTHGVGQAQSVPVSKLACFPCPSIKISSVYDYN